jgi:pyruvate dehydrogenase E2 component (dihydrolipoamide acetyltransferase)
MARWEFKLPDIGEGIAEGEIVAWLVHPGDVVREDQPIVEVMTDKATVTITAPRAGVVTETRGRVGEVVAVHSVLVVFEVSGPTGHTGAHAHSTLAAPAAPSNVNGHGADPGGDDRPAAAAPSALAAPGTRSAAPRPDGGYYNIKPLATPSTRKRARDMEIDLRRVPPTGPLGRVTTRDVETFARTGGVPAQQEHAPATANHLLEAEVVSAAVDPFGARRAGGADRDLGARRAGAPDERIPYAGVRRKIGQKMVQSKTTAAHFTFVEECDASALKAVRERLLGPAGAQGVKLSFLPLVVKAVVASLKKHPVLAATLDEANQEIVLRKDFNIGIATATPAGLMVPVVKRADRLSTIEVAREIERLAADARAGRSRLEDLQGSSFTITSLGAQGGLLATPIINYPEVAILGVHQMKQKPVVRGGQIVIGDVMLLSLSFDHRVVDGHVGAAFAYEVIGYLEHPERLLLE